MPITGRSATKCSGCSRTHPGTGGYSSLNYRHHAAVDRWLPARKRVFAQTLAESCSAPAAFMVQDYHFYPLPELLRAPFPDTPILHFTHIPFPDPRCSACCPRHGGGTILEGLLVADCVGLQTHQDTHAFLSCCSELLGAEVERDTGTVIARDGRRVAVRAYPASVDPKRCARQCKRALWPRHGRSWGAPCGASHCAGGPARPEQEPHRRIPGVRAAAGNPAGPARPGPFSGILVPSRTDLSVYRS